MSTFAGQWGPEPFIDQRGNAVPSAVVTVYEPDGTTVASLYTDRTKTAPLANPLPVGVVTGQPGLDDEANGIFYADPGRYVLAAVVGGVEKFRAPVTVDVDPSEAAANAPQALVVAQVVPVSSRNIVHNYGREPVVSVVIGGEDTIVDVIHNSLDDLTLEFAAPTAFRAVLI